MVNNYPKRNNVIAVINKRKRRKTPYSSIIKIVSVVLVLINIYFLWGSQSKNNDTLDYVSDLNEHEQEKAIPTTETHELPMGNNKLEDRVDDDRGNDVHNATLLSQYPRKNIHSSDTTGRQQICDTQIQIAIVSDRKKNDYPLKALINSILSYTSTPVTVNIVTKNRIPFMDELNTTSYFNIQYHDSTELQEASQHLMQETGFKTLHYSASFGMQKLFLEKLHFTQTTQKVLVLDDDITFFTDITPLWEIIMEHPHRTSLYCPEDPDRVERHFINKHAPDNGHPLRYCNSGLIGMPVSSNFTRLAIEATQKMTTQYDFSYSVADQDIVNRMLAEDNDGYELIPCQWACDVNSCGGRAPNRGKCFTCKDKKCYAYHWLNKRFESNNGNRWGKPEYNFKWYYLRNSTELLHTTFVPRVATKC